MIDDDYVEGYRDGHNPDSPEPNENRSARYKHSFAVARAELNGDPIPAAISRANILKVEKEEEDRFK